MSALTQLEPFVDECSSILRKRFTEFANQKKTINMAHWMQCYAFDVVGEITVRPPHHLRGFEESVLTSHLTGSKALRLPRRRPRHRRNHARHPQIPHPLLARGSVLGISPPSLETPLPLPQIQGDLSNNAVHAKPATIPTLENGC